MGFPAAARTDAGRLPCCPNDGFTFFARWRWCRRERPVVRRVLCAAPVAALRARCVVPDAVPLARFAAPVAALYRTSPSLRAASWARRAWWWFGLQPVTPKGLQARPQLQRPLHIQEKRVRFDEIPASAPIVHPCFTPVCCCPFWISAASED